MIQILGENLYFQNLLLHASSLIHVLCLLIILYRKSKRKCLTSSRFLFLLTFQLFVNLSAFWPPSVEEFFACLGRNIRRFSSIQWICNESRHLITLGGFHLDWELWEWDAPMTMSGWKKNEEFFMDYEQRLIWIDR